MNARPNFQRIDVLGQRLADQAFRTLISLCPEIKTASPACQEAVCAAMRAKVAPAADSLLEDVRLPLTSPSTRSVLSSTAATVVTLQTTS